MSSPGNLLDRIVAARRLSLARSRAARTGTQAAGARTDGARADGALSEEGAPRRSAGAAGGAEARVLPRRSFEAALRSPGRRVIAEIKRRSPSAGVIREPLDPGKIAAEYAGAGAAALSVVTEPEFFGGSDEDLSLARAAVSLPVLRKDFLLDREGILEARALGADAVLLLASVLSRGELAGLLRAAKEAGLDALVEVHDEAEMEAALEAGSTIIGVNSRDLRDFTVDLARAERLAPRIPEGTVRVAESGIRGREDLSRLEAAGYRAFLVGESLLRRPDPAVGLRELLA